MKHIVKISLWIPVMMLWLVANLHTAQGQESSAGSGPSEKDRVAVLDINSEGGTSTEKGALTDKFRESLLKTKRFTLVDRSQMNKILQEQAFQQTACTTADCAAAAGKLLGVRYIITTNASKLSADTWQVSSMMVNVQTAETDRAESVQVRGDILKLLNEGIPVLAMKLGSREKALDQGEIPMVAPRQETQASAPVPAAAVVSDAGEASAAGGRSEHTILTIGSEGYSVNYNYSNTMGDNGTQTVSGSGIGLNMKSYLNQNVAVIVGASFGGIREVSETCALGCDAMGSPSQTFPANGNYIGFHGAVVYNGRWESFGWGIGLGGGYFNQNYSVDVPGNKLDLNSTQMGVLIHADMDWKFSSGFVVGLMLESTSNPSSTGKHDDLILSSGHDIDSVSNGIFGINFGWAF